MNERPNLSHSLTDFRDINKINDMLAVDLFSLENVQILLSEGDYIGRYYLLLFACEHVAMEIVELSKETRREQTVIAFGIFKD